ncbi:hypothetical protein [Streptomyces sp. NPDC088730]|uniref:hypothetical protein n=1 Tax=Streptomyces sp. NPDC088730 TaxID=3365877 RepID=UPI0037F1D25B
MNTGELSQEQFREVLPTVRAAEVLAPDAAGVAALLDSVRHSAGDGLAAARAELELPLLRPSAPPSRTRFNEAALGLCEVADEHRVRMARRLLPGIPAQRGAPEEADAAGEEALEPAPEA